MKKLFLSAIMLASACTLFAQEQVSLKTTEVTTTYQVPVPIQTNFQVAYPGVTRVEWQPVTWQPMNNWVYATYKDENNKIVHVYYNTQPYYLIRDESYKVSLPVLNTFVPENVVTNAVNFYGNNLYSITAIKSADNEEMYHVTLIKNGMLETATMNANSVALNTVK